MAEVSIPRPGDVDPRTIVQPTGPTFNVAAIRASRDAAQAQRMARTPEQVVSDAMRTDSGLDEREKKSARTGVPETGMIEWLRTTARQHDREYVAGNLADLQQQALTQAKDAGYIIHLADSQQFDN